MTSAQGASQVTGISGLVGNGTEVPGAILTCSVGFTCILQGSTNVYLKEAEGNKTFKDKVPLSLLLLLLLLLFVLCGRVLTGFFT